MSTKLIQIRFLRNILNNLSFTASKYKTYSNLFYIELNLYCIQTRLYHKRQNVPGLRNEKHTLFHILKLRSFTLQSSTTCVSYLKKGRWWIQWEGALCPLWKILNPPLKIKVHLNCGVYPGNSIFQYICSWYTRGR